VIGTDAHAAVETLALLDEGEHGLYQIFTFQDVVILGFVNLLLKVLPSIGEVTRIDPDLLHGIGNELGHDGLEVHIGTKGNIVTLLEKSVADLGGGIRLPLTLDGNPNEIESLIGTAHNLLDGSIDVGRGRRRHGLPNDGMVGTELNRAAFDRTGLATCNAVQILAVLTEGTQLIVSIARFDGRGPQNVGGGCWVGSRHVKGRRR